MSNTPHMSAISPRNRSVLAAQFGVQEGDRSFPCQGSGRIIVGLHTIGIYGVVTCTAQTRAKPPQESGQARSSCVNLSRCLCLVRPAEPRGVEQSPKFPLRKRDPVHECLFGNDLGAISPDHSQMDTRIPGYVPQNQVVIFCPAGRSEQGSRN